MLGGGVWSTQNKVLPGAYITFVSTARTEEALTDRGIVAFPMAMNWGDKFIELDTDMINSNSMRLLGYNIDDEELIDIREIMHNATKLLLYRINDEGLKASNELAIARYAGTRGNEIKISVSNSVDASGAFEVVTYLGTAKVDKQTVLNAGELIDNDFVVFKKDAELSVTTSSSLTGGTNSTVDGESYSKAMDFLSGKTFNAIGFTTTTEAILGVIKAWTIRMRDEVGAKFQTVICGTADHEGIVTVADEKAVAWVTGAIGGCNINETLTNKAYNGEKEIKHDYSQAELEEFISGGKFVFHKVGDTVNVLSDINSLITYNVEKGKDFSLNQVIRIIDTVATTTANIFSNIYLGKVQNNEDGRVSLKSQLVAMCEQLQNEGAIQGFESENITVEAGELRKAVVINMAIMPVVAMEQLYCKVMIN